MTTTTTSAAVAAAGYDLTAPADVYIATQGGTRSGNARVLWRMTVEDAMKVCSHPSTCGVGAYGSEWALMWTCHEVKDIAVGIEDMELFAPDDGRFDDLFDELGVTVLASRALILAGKVVRPAVPVRERPTRPAPIMQLDIFGEAVPA